MEADIRSMWARVEGAGARALPLAGALLRGAGALHAKQHQYLLSALEVLPDSEIFAPAVRYMICVIRVAIYKTRFFIFI